MRYLKLQLRCLKQASLKLIAAALPDDTCSERLSSSYDALSLTNCFALIADTWLLPIVPCW
jgi:hypothetical protein